MVSWLDLCRLAFANLSINKFRSSLTVLGMVFGTGAVIATLSSSEGASRFIRAELQKMGTNVIRITANPANPHLLADTDKALIQKYSSVFETLSLTVEHPGTETRYKNQLRNVTLIGAQPTFFASTQLAVQNGRTFIPEEEEHSEFVAVIGATTKKELFEKHNAIGEYLQVYMGDVAWPVRVIGILKEKGSGAATDTALILPKKTLLKIAPPKNQHNSLLGTLAHEEDTDKAKKTVAILMKRRFPSGLTISDARETIERTKKIWEKQNRVGMFLALISLMTGGVGIMNVMLLSVTQRKKEIGLRKTVGATNHHILVQFLLEAVTVCLTGSVFGVIVGSALGQYIARLMGQWEAVTSFSSILLALGFATATGIFFGLTPALMASRLEPYEALRG